MIVDHRRSCAWGQPAQTTDDDRLGFKPYVNAISSFLTHGSTKAPLTLSIEGRWGSGKSAASCLSAPEGEIVNASHRPFAIACVSCTWTVTSSSFFRNSFLIRKRYPLYNRAMASLTRQRPQEKLQKALDELKNSESKLRQVIDTIPALACSRTKFQTCEAYLQTRKPLCRPSTNTSSEKEVKNSTKNKGLTSESPDNRMVVS